MVRETTLRIVKLVLVSIAGEAAGSTVAGEIASLVVVEDREATKSIGH